jgi:hypothetical protein
LIAQNQEDYVNFFSSNLEYELARTNASLQDDGTFQPAKTIVVVDLSDSAKVLINSLGVKEWIELLHNDKTSYKANMILYSLYRKDAIVYYGRDINVKEWLQGESRKVDIVYWENYLTDEKNFKNY